MSDKPNNPPAFPVSDNVAWDKWNNTAVAGMTMRDYFAIHATEDDVSSRMPPTLGALDEFKTKNGFGWSRQWARYAFAGDMLKEREKYDL